MQFGKQINTDPRLLSCEELREYLTQHGVISFTNFRLSISELNAIMSKIGPLQNWEEQQAPINYTDKNVPTLINLFNDDFLGKSRMSWHTDQTYLSTPYLPIRCLYTPKEPSPGNITSFLDINYISDIILNEYPELEFAQARYNIGTGSETYSIRPLFSFNKHTNRKVIRFDTRMQVLDPGIDINKFTNLIRRGVFGSPKFSVEWTKWVLVIFDNNRCPHRRSAMDGDCHLHRLTSTFWLEDLQ